MDAKSSGEVRRRSLFVRPPARRWRQITAAVSRADCRLTVGVVNYCKRSAKLRICCSQSSSVMLRMPKSKRRRVSLFSPCDIPVLTVN